jgi:hypothetical protein
MSGTTSVPPIQFTPAGLVLPSDSDILAGVQADQNAAFGGNLNPALSTPQGQLATSEAAIISANNADFALFVNQIDPATASGIMQDAIGRIYFLDRLPALATTVNVVCTGRTGVTIPIGATVSDSSGNLYNATAAGTIPSGGTITLPFAAQQTGPTACPAGAITGAPYRTIPGWDSATNIAAGVIGRAVENRTDFEYRRQLTVAANAVGSLAAIYAAVVNVAGVSDAYCTENYTDIPVTIDGVTLASHSLYAAVVGGADQDIGNAIWSKVDVGCNFNGNTTVTVTDTSGYNLPAPTYAVTFNRPTAMPIYFAVTVQNLSSTPNATVAASIKAAIVAAFGGADGGPRARIHSTLTGLRYVPPVAAVGALAILSIFIGAAASPTGSSVYVGIGSTPTITTGNIGVTFV